MSETSFIFTDEFFCIAFCSYYVISSFSEDINFMFFFGESVFKLFSRGY